MSKPVELEVRAVYPTIPRQSRFKFSKAATKVSRQELWTYTKQNFAKIAEDIGALGIRVVPCSQR
jgi:hypothetical protein